MKYIITAITLALIGSIVWLGRPYNLDKCNTSDYEQCADILALQMRYNLISLIAGNHPILMNLDISHDDKCDNPVNASGITPIIVMHNNIHPDKLCLRIKNKADK